MQLTFFDTSISWGKMLPLTYTRPVAELRIGILKIHEKWAMRLKTERVSFRTEAYLQNVFCKPDTKTLTISGNSLPSDNLVAMLHNLSENQVLTHDNAVIAGFFNSGEEISTANREVIELTEIRKIEYPWDIFQMNGEEISNDYQLLTDGRTSRSISDPHTIIYGEDIFLEEGAKVKAAILNAENGPIYLGANSEVQEGALIKGPFALGNHSVVNMGGKMRGDNTIGPHSKVGGEISNSVIQGYSNKGHEGFLGNSVLGEWCNIGADTNNSNLKNNYANVKMWDYEGKRFKDTGLQFCGLIMGDHSKCGINTMFNTGTSIGVSANIFGEGFPRNIIPSFAWGGASGFTTYQTKKAFETAELVMKRRGIALKNEDRDILSHIFEATSDYRVWDKK